MLLNIKQILNHLPEGEYKGIITSVNLTEDQNFIWFHISGIKGLKGIFNTSMSVNSPAFFHLASHFLTNSNDLETEDLLNQKILFKISDKKLGEKLYSKIESIDLIEE